MLNEPSSIYFRQLKLREDNKLRGPSPRLTRLRKLRDDLLSQIEVAKEALHKNLCDTQELKKWDLALIKLTTTNTLPSHEVDESLQEANTKLQKVLETHQDDHESKFELGMVYYHILESGKYKETYYEFLGSPDSANWYANVPSPVPEACDMLDVMQSYLPSESDEEQEPSIEDASEILSFEQDCNSEIEDTNYLYHADDLRSMGQELCWSSLITRNQKYKKELIKGAIEKFSAALLLEPDDIVTKLQLATAHLCNCDVRDKDGKAEYNRLVQECDQLSEEKRLMVGPLYMDENEIIKRVPIAEQCSHHKAPTKKDREGFLFREMRKGGERFFEPAAMLRRMANEGERFGIPVAAMQLCPMAQIEGQDIAFQALLCGCYCTNSFPENEGCIGEEH